MHNNDIEQYDIDIVNRYGIPFVESGEKKFVIYHLKGQHFTYASNYPESFAHFKKSDYEHFEGLSGEGARIMAEYDNATLYNDYVLGTIIDLLRDKNAILVYTPDHGEEAYDYRESSGRYVEAPITSIRLFYEVPVMIWTSESFRHKHPDVMPALRRNTHKAIYNTDLPHTILDIIDIQTKTFNPDLSLLRDGGGRKHRHVWMHDTDYDAMRDEIYRRKLRYEQ